MAAKSSHPRYVPEEVSCPFASANGDGLLSLIPSFYKVLAALAETVDPRELPTWDKVSKANPSTHAHLRLTNLPIMVLLPITNHRNVTLQQPIAPPSFDGKSKEEIAAIKVILPILVSACFK